MISVLRALPLVLVVTAGAFSGDARAAAPVVPPFAAIEGNWATQGYGAVVRIGACDAAPSALCGWLVWAWEPEEMEPGAVGGLMFSGARYDGEKWKKGRLRNPEDGRAYRGSIRQVSADRLELKGCAAAGIICRTETWRRLESLPHVAGLPDVSRNDADRNDADQPQADE